MKKIFLFIIFSSIIFSYYGQSIIEVEKEWRLEGKPSKINFTGVFLLNNSDQEITSIDVDPPLEIISDGERVIVHYYGNFDGNETFRARAIVSVAYDPKIKEDPPLAYSPRNTTELTEYDEEMMETARSLSSSSLATAAALSNWVHDNMVYDISYFDRNIPAKRVFEERRGVCSEYAHLFIALANSVGLETRYIGGYAKSDSWQPHAWAQVRIGERWVSFDPTFGEGGVLSSERVAMAFGRDAEDIYDKVQSGREIDIDANVSFKILEEKKREENVSLSLDEKNRTVEATIQNDDDNIAIGSFWLQGPEYAQIKKKVVVIQPHSAYRESIPIQGKFSNDLRYYIPFEASFNDQSISKEIVVENKSESKTCLAAFILLAVLFLKR